MSRSISKVVVILALFLLMPGFQCEMRSVLEPPDPTGGSGCQECGTKEIPITGGGVLIIDPACVPAPFAARLSGHTCQIDAAGENCRIQDFCFFA